MTPNTGESDSIKHFNKNNKSVPDKIKKAGKELCSGLTQLLVLRILRKGPLHGYELASNLEPIYGRRLSPGTIYPLLQRMEKKEYIESHISTVSGRQRRTYVLTRLGRIALENAQNYLEDFITKHRASLDEDSLGYELLKNLAQLRLLVLLSDSPMHGYELAEQLEQKFNQQIAFGTIYPSLHRLVEKGYIESKSQWEGDRERKVYSLTTFGKNAMNYALERLSIIAFSDLFT